MAKKKYISKLHYLFATIGLVFLGVGAYALFLLAYKGVSDLLLLINITNPYMQLGVIVFVVFMGLILSGYSGVKALKRLAEK